MKTAYETHARGIRIHPGQWRPHYPFEQIVWVSPPWPSQDYIWLDFPEAVIADERMLFLSHVNPAFPAAFPDLPKVTWNTCAGGIEFERRLPDGVVFGGAVRRAGKTRIALKLFIRNGGRKPLRKIRLQTCAYLRACAEFAAPTMRNKYVHLAGRGWLDYDTAAAGPFAVGEYWVGWPRGEVWSDVPAMAVRSGDGKRFMAMTWGRSTYRLTGNAAHPCLHADPVFPDLAPGRSASIRGALIFGDWPLKARVIKTYEGMD